MDHRKRLTTNAYERQRDLEPRLKIAEGRVEALQDACNAYEEATQDPTPEQEARLSRLEGLSNRANFHLDNLAERIDIMRKIQTLEDEALALRDPFPCDRYRKRIERVRASRARGRKLFGERV